MKYIGSTPTIFGSEKKPACPKRVRIKYVVPANEKIFIARPANTSSAPSVNESKPNKTAVTIPAMIPAAKPAHMLSV